MRRRPLLLLPLLLAAPGIARAADATLEAVMRALASRPAGEARFEESKSIPGLSSELPSSGTLSWSAPDRMAKHTTWPHEEILRAEGDRLLLERPAQGLRHEISLAQTPEMRPFIEAIRATMAGDLEVLRRHFAIDFAALPDGGWRMRLSPLSPRVRVALQQVEIRGREGLVLQVVTEASDGQTRLQVTHSP